MWLGRRSAADVVGVLGAMGAAAGLAVGWAAGSVEVAATAAGLTTAAGGGSGLVVWLFCRSAVQVSRSSGVARGDVFRLEAGHASAPVSGEARCDGDTEELRRLVRVWAEFRREQLRRPPGLLLGAGSGLDEVRQAPMALVGEDGGAGPSGAALGRPRSWDELVGPVCNARLRRAVVTARPGYGKSTLLTMMAFDAFELLVQELAKDVALEDVVLPVLVRCPALVEAALLADPATGLTRVIAGLAIGETAARDADGRLIGWIESRLRAPRTVLLFDGLDEVREPDPDRLERRSWLVSRLRELVEESDSALYLSTRPYDVPDPAIPGAAIVELVGFDDDAVRRFVEASVLDSAMAAAIVRRLEGSLTSVARVPLLLAFLCLVEGSQDQPAAGNAPLTSFDLYQGALRLLVQAAWREQPHARRRQERLTRALPLVAWHLVEPGWRSEFTIDDLVAAAGSEEMAYELLDAGIVIPVTERLGFLHASFLEHLIARYLRPAGPRGDDDRWETTLRKHVRDPAWDEVWPQLAGAMNTGRDSGATRLLAIVEHARGPTAAARVLSQAKQAISPGDRARLVDHLMALLEDPETQHEASDALAPFADELIGPLGAIALAPTKPWKTRLTALRLVALSPRNEATEVLAAAKQSSNIPSLVAEASRALAKSTREPVRSLPFEAGPVHRMPGTVVDTYRRFHPGVPVDLIEAAFAFARRAHEGQRRRNGEPAINHPIAVARIVAELGLDDISVAAALVHDTTEDAGVGVSQLQQLFGPEVANVVAEMSALSVNQAEPDWSLPMEGDARTLVLQLADRLHNMGTLAVMPPNRQRAVADQCLTVHVPIASSLGLADMSAEIEDLAFAALNPKQYAELDHLLWERFPDYDDVIGECIDTAEALLDQEGLTASVVAQPRHRLALYESISPDPSRSIDTLELRVIVDTADARHKALHILKERWPILQQHTSAQPDATKPLQDKVRARLAGPSGHPIEIHIQAHQASERRPDWTVPQATFHQTDRTPRAAMTDLDRQPGP